MRTRVGHSFIKAVMKETDAIFAGEHSGHYYFRDNFRADSGLIAAVVLLAALSDSGGTLSRLRRALRPLRGVRRDQHRGRRRQRRRIDTVEDAFAGDAALTMSRPDGLLVEADDWWFNLRPSNTEPLLRLNVEARRRGRDGAPARPGPRARDRPRPTKEPERPWPSPRS